LEIECSGAVSSQLTEDRMTPARLDNPWQPEPFNVKMWLTRPDQRGRCAEQPGYLSVGSPVDGCPTISVDAFRHHQVMSDGGIGISYPADQHRRV
jgi:hypothetical protein